MAESLDWAAALAVMNIERLDRDALQSTVSALLKHSEDQRRFRSVWLEALLAALMALEPGNEALHLRAGLAAASTRPQVERFLQTE